MTSEKESLRMLLKILDMHRHELIAAGADPVLTQQYASLLAFARQNGESILRAPSSKKVEPKLTLPPPEQIWAWSLNEIEKLVREESTPRRLLELIASVRFG